MSKKDEALKLALENICAAKLCEINSMSSRHEMIRLMDAAITVLREALAEQPAQQQEPYGWKVYGVNSLFMGEFAEADAKAEAKRIGGTCIAFPLYTSPPASKPLTDEQISDLWDGHTVPVFGKTGINPIVFARAIEAAHSIKEK